MIFLYIYTMYPLWKTIHRTKLDNYKNIQLLMKAKRHLEMLCDVCRYKCFIWVVTSVCLFVLFIAAWAIYQLSGGCHHYRWQGCKFFSMLGAQGLWAGRDLYRANTYCDMGPRFSLSHSKDRHPRPTVGFYHSLFGLIRKTGTHVPQWGSNPLWDVGASLSDETV
jgi:hypothetical protein